MFLRHRHRLPEIMDQPDLEVARHQQALRALSRINALSNSAGILWPPLVSLAAATPHPLLILDIATGGGDVPLRLWKRARRRGVSLQIEGCDLSPVAIDHARAAATAAKADIHFFVHDILAGPPPGKYDVAVCSLFLHHLEEDQAVTLLRHMAIAAPVILVNDLERGVLGWSLAWLGTRLLTSSHVVHVDGPRSVAGAFKLGEAKALADRAGLRDVELTRHWPCRFRLTGRRP
jgi:2-polyprenyl-3-methyl-5-hydroxy-6-metoxy-1,4-benzoquinol methylase